MQVRYTLHLTVEGQLGGNEYAQLPVALTWEVERVLRELRDDDTERATVRWADVYEPPEGAPRTSLRIDGFFEEPGEDE